MSDNTEADVYIPEAVRRQVAHAEQLARDAGMLNAGEPLEPGLEEAPAEASQEQPADIPPSEEPPQAPAAIQQEDPGWEQRYRTLQGKYDAEINQLRRDNDSVRNLLADMHRQDEAEKQRASRQTTSIVIPDEHIQEYGSELIDAARQWARAETQPEIDRLAKQQEEILERQRIAEQQAVVARIEGYFNSDPVLSQRWQQLNHDQEFISWLAQVDPYSGQPRQVLLNQAYSYGDAARCANFFRTYIAEHTAMRGLSPTPAQTPGYQNGNGSGQGADRVSLEDLAVPGRARGGAPGGGAPAEKRIWTAADIRRFYDERRRGRFVGREAEADRLEQDLFVAQSEGRYRQ